MDMEKVAELGIFFRLSPIPEQSNTRIYKLIIEANVIGTDDIIIDKRHHWTLGYVFENKLGVFISLKMSSPSEERIRVHSEFRSSAAQTALKKVEERISYLIAPKYLKAIRQLEVAQELFSEIHKQLLIFGVIDT